MKPGDIVTVETLRELKACEDQVELFERTFPGGAALTLENLQHAASVGLDVHWLAVRVLLSSLALEAYEQAKAAALEAYQQATAPAWEAYQQATAPAWEAYQQATAPAWEAYQQATAPAWEAYQQAKAAALWEALQ